MSESKRAPKLPPPKSKSKRINVTLRGDLHDALVELAEERDGEPIAATAAALIESGLRSLGKL